MNTFRLVVGVLAPVSGDTMALLPSDKEPTNVKTQAAFPTSMTATDWIEVRGYSHVEWHVIVADQQNTTGLTYRVEYCYRTVGAPHLALAAEYMDTSGTATVKQVEYEVAMTGIFPGKDGYGISVPVHGRFMRLVFKGTPAVGTDKAAVTAYRRTS